MDNCHYSCVHASICPSGYMHEVFLGYMPKSGISWHMICMSSVLLDNAQMFSSIFVSSYTLPMVCNNSCWSTSSTKLSIFMLFFFNAPFPRILWVWHSVWLWFLFTGCLFLPLYSQMLEQFHQDSTGNHWVFVEWINKVYSVLVD